MGSKRRKLSVRLSPNIVFKFETDVFKRAILSVIDFAEFLGLDLDDWSRSWWSLWV